MATTTKPIFQIHNRTLTSNLTCPRNFPEIQDRYQIPTTRRMSLNTIFNNDICISFTDKLRGIMQLMKYLPFSAYNLNLY